MSRLSLIASTFILQMILASSAHALPQHISMLFIGNSHTYIPVLGTPEDPALPKMIAQIARSIDPDLNITFSHSTPGGYRLEQHFNNVTSVELLKKRYDKVVIQGNSIEPLELPPWWLKTEDVGVTSFSVFLPKILDLAFQQNRDVTLYVTWGWNPQNPYFEPTHPGLYFPNGAPRAGERWCGVNKYDYQRLLDESWVRHSRGYNTKLALVGDAWLALQDAHIVSQDDLYVSGDWVHATVIGAYASALVLVRDSLELDISKSQFVPLGVDPKVAARMRWLLSRH